MSNKDGSGLLEPKDPANKNQSRAGSRSRGSGSGKSPSPISWSRTTPSEALHKATELGDADAVERILKAALGAVDLRTDAGAPRCTMPRR